jgi:hypothetical protein
MTFVGGPEPLRSGVASVSLGSERDEAAKLSRRFGALDLLHLGDAHLSAGDTELRERVDQLSREGVRVEGADVRTAMSAPAGVWRTWYSSI